MRGRAVLPAKEGSRKPERNNRVSSSCLKCWPARLHARSCHLRCVQDTLEPAGCLGDLGCGRGSHIMRPTLVAAVTHTHTRASCLPRSWYCIRASLWAFGYEPPAHAAAVFHAATPQGVPLEATATLTWPDGKVATFDCSFRTAMRQARAPESKGLVCSCRRHHPYCIPSRGATVARGCWYRGLRHPRRLRHPSRRPVALHSHDAAAPLRGAPRRRRGRSDRRRGATRWIAPGRSHVAQIRKPRTGRRRCSRGRSLLVHRRAPDAGRARRVS